MQVLQKHDLHGCTLHAKTHVDYRMFTAKAFGRKMIQRSNKGKGIWLHRGFLLISFVHAKRGTWS